MPDYLGYIGRDESASNADEIEHIKNRLTPGSGEWKAEASKRLRAGYGVEDIAVQMECSPRYVRDHVTMLREMGKLDNWRSVGALAASLVKGAAK